MTSDLGILHKGQNFGHTEGSDHGGQQTDPSRKIDITKGKADMGMNPLHTDHGHKKPQESGDPALKGIFGRRQVTGNDNTEDGQPEELERLEVQMRSSPGWE